MADIPSAAIGNLIEAVDQLAHAMNRVAAAIESLPRDSSGGRGSYGSFGGYSIRYGSGAGDWAPPVGSA